jgi:hypothetical protein
MGRVAPYPEDVMARRWLVGSDLTEYTSAWAAMQVWAKEFRRTDRSPPIVEVFGSGRRDTITSTVLSRRVRTELVAAGKPFLDADYELFLQGIPPEDPRRVQKELINRTDPV